MFAIYKKEILNYFSSSTAYLLIASYLLFNILFLFILDTPYNIINGGYLNFEEFFFINPYIFLFIVPALTMGLISQERTTNNLELILSHPIKISSLYLGKFAAVLTLIIFAVLATLIFPVALSYFGEINSTLDYGAITASYLSLILIISAFISIGIFSSSIVSNQISSFILSLTTSALLLIGFEKISDLIGIEELSKFIKSLSMKEHLYDFSIGVINSYDLVYFLSLTLIFSLLSIYFIDKLDGEKTDIKLLKKLLLKIVATSVLPIIASFFIFKYDFTDDKKYTLNSISYQIAEDIDREVKVSLLLSGDLPKGFKYLENEAKRIVEDLAQSNSNITFNQIDEDEFKNNKNFINFIESNNIAPINLEVKKSSEKKSKLVYPYLIFSNSEKFILVDILKRFGGLSPEQQLNKSLENLEFSIASSLEKIGLKVDKKIGILRGHNELENYRIADFINRFKSTYTLEEIVLNDSTPISDFEKNINDIDLLFVANPQNKFSEKEKLLLDQFIVKGGNSIWLMSGTSARMDSLYLKGRSLALYTDNNLNDLFFKYGFRVNPDVVSDYRSSMIKLASGNLGDQVQYHSFPWPFSPIVVSDNQHPIVKNIELLKLNFPSSIDTIKSKGISKTVLLKSSERTKVYGVPNMFDLSQVERELNLNEYNNSSKVFSLLLEGKFTSAFKNRILPFRPSDYKETSDKNSKIIVVSDANFASSDYANTQYLPMGYDKWFNFNYGNGDFISNCIVYASSNYPVLDLNKKEINLRLLDKSKIKKQGSTFEIIILIYPLIYSLLFALATIVYRKFRFRNL